MIKYHCLFNIGILEYETKHFTDNQKESQEFLSKISNDYLTLFFDDVSEIELIVLSENI